MELVYLWVEEYKNIHRQGFNFSSRFRCEYNPESNELTIDDNPEYIENFFGDNINVTAIVGKNGSGKSSLLEIMYGITNNKEFQEKKFFALYIKDTNNNFYIQNPHKISINNEKNKNYIFDYIWFHAENDNYHTLWLNYNKKNNYLDSAYNKQSNYHIGGNDIFIFKHIHVLNKYKIYLSYLKNKYFFTHMQVKLYLKDKAIIYEKNIEDKLILKEQYRIKCINILDNLMKKDKKIVRMINSPSDINDFFAYNTFLYYVHFFILRYEDFSKEDRNYFYNTLNEILKDTSLKYIFIVIEDFSKKLEKSNNVYTELYNEFLANLIYIKDNLDKFILEKTNYSNKKFIWNIEIEEIKLINDVINNTKNVSGISTDEAYFIDFVEYDFINFKKNIYYSNLSDGEREILKIYIDFIHHSDLYKNKNIIFILDEIDNSLHPFWKKELIYIFINLLNEFIDLFNKSKITLIFSTHSPFLLSDIPKQNIIFLDTDVEGNCQVVDGLNDKKETFGANIHTLLSDSFFMSDGLMGEFAKSKINEIIAFHDKVVEKSKQQTPNYIHLKTEYEENKTKFWRTQSIIGEEYLKQVIKNHLVDIESTLYGVDIAKREEAKRLREEANRLDPQHG